MPLNQSNSYDVIIAGAGIAGLSLAAYIVAEFGEQLRILVADRGFTPIADRTLCFWDDTSLPPGVSPDYSWKSFETSDFDNSATYNSPLETYQYHCVRSERYLGDLMTLLSKNLAISWAECSIDGFSDDGHPTMHTNAGDFKAPYIFQSVRFESKAASKNTSIKTSDSSDSNFADPSEPASIQRSHSEPGETKIPAESTSVQRSHSEPGESKIPAESASVQRSHSELSGSKIPAESALKQHFIGLEIRVNPEEFPHTFDADRVTLMDFRVNQQDGVGFMYILPFSAHQALVEYTLFSKNLLPDEAYISEIHRYLREHYSLEKHNFTVVRREKGNIPMKMNETRADEPQLSGIVPIGVVSGITKPTTGYTFSRIHRKNKAIVAQLATHHRPSPTPNTTTPPASPETFTTSALSPNQKKQIPPASPETTATSSPRRFRFYDRLLLYILVSTPEIAPEIFTTLFRRNSADSILHFLDEKSTLWQEIRIFATLPKWPFLRAVWNSYLRPSPLSTSPSDTQSLPAQNPASIKI